MSIISVLKRKNNKTLFTTPSHGGKFCMLHKFYQWYRADISETDTHNPQKALKEAEKYAADVYGTKYTKFLTNGSTSGIITAVLASRAKKVLIWENAHPCHRNACLLSNTDIVEYSLPLDNELGIHRAITTDKVKTLLEEHNPSAIIITSPTYEGFVTDVKSISQLCKEKKVILIVDEAHGALYPFSNDLPESAVKHADFTVQSLHKTAGGLNPTALLHSNDIDPTKSLDMINTTSPSYPLLATIEANIRFLNSKRGKNKLNKLIETIKKLNLKQYNDDPTKIILKGGYQLSEELFDRYGIEDEKTNNKTTMLLCGIGTDKAKLERLSKVLANLRT